MMYFIGTLVGTFLFPVANNYSYLYSYYFVRVIKSRRMSWAWHVARMGDRKGVYRVLVGEN